MFKVGWQFDRPVRFRIWDAETQTMTYLRNLDELVDFGQKIREQGASLEHGPYTLLQYTELVDRRGQDIYEGDLVQVHPTREIIYTRLVAWYPERASWWIFKLNKMFDVILKAELQPQLEVCGNIFEHPEKAQD